MSQDTMAGLFIGWMLGMVIMLCFMRGARNKINSGEPTKKESL